MADRLDALDRRQRALHLLLEARPQRAARNCEGDRDVHGAAIDRDVSNHVQLDHGAAELGVNDPLERLQHLFPRNGHK